MGPGPGRPTNEDTCGGSGASHGSKGGAGLAFSPSYKNCPNEVPQRYEYSNDYESMKNSTFMGSGGGGKDQRSGGQGGGIINL